MAAGSKHSGTAAADAALAADAAADAPMFSADLLTEQLKGGRFGEVVRTLDVCMGQPAHWDPRVVDWCIVWGFRKGHVPVLYKLVRNLLKWRCGRLPTSAELVFSVRCGMLLLMRTAQDVRSCEVDLAKTDRGFVYAAFRDKVQSWVQGWHPASLPTTAAAADALEGWLTRKQSTVDFALPSPAWAASFTVMCMSTFDFRRPCAADVQSFQRSAVTVSDTRQAVARSFVAAVRKCGTLEDVFRASLDDVAPTDVIMLQVADKQSGSGAPAPATAH